MCSSKLARGGLRTNARPDGYERRDQLALQDWSSWQSKTIDVEGNT